MSVASFLDT
jgi:hypothetical protein